MLPVGKILTDLAATGTELNMHQHRWCYLHKNTHTHTRSVLTVTGHLSEGSFVRNVVVQIPKFDAKPNHKPNPGLTLTPALTLTLT